MAQINERLVDCARELRAAPHGAKQAIYERYCQEFVWLKRDGTPAAPRLMQALKKAGLSAERAQRADKGKCALTQFEAEEIVRWIRDNARANGKNMVSLVDAVAKLRAAGHIRAERTNPKTGEITPLSENAIRTAITAYGLSADVLDTPPPAIRMKAKYPNHCWQVDASLCVLYYLPKVDGLQVMDEKAFNTNKPANFKRIEQDRVWRYLVVDKATGSIYVEYVFGGESGANLTQVFINAMQQRPGEFWGVPELVYCDPGAANTGAVFKGLCRHLEIDLLWHLPGNARATGTVEKPQDIVERQFEGNLGARRVHSLRQLNEAAARWRRKFNAIAIHSRHRMSRFEAWNKLIGGHLVQPPAAELCRELASTKPESRRITQHLTVEFDGKEWSAEQFPGVYRHMPVEVCRNPWDDTSIRIIETLADGALRYHYAPVVELDELGQPVNAPIIGEEFAAHAMTPPDVMRKKLKERSLADQPPAIAGKKQRHLVFNGKVDPFLPLEQAFEPTYLPRTADEVREVTAVMLARVDTAPLNHVQAAKALRGLLDRNLEAAEYQWIAHRFADGVPPDQVEALADQLLRGDRAEATGTDGATPAADAGMGLRRVK